MKKMCLIWAMLAAAVSSQALIFTMDFETDAGGNAIADLATIDTQYQLWGITFSPNHFSGGLWATNTDVRATRTSTGFGYDSNMGNVLHSFDGWTSEDGDASIRMEIATGARSVSARLIGDESAASFMEAYARNGDGSYSLLGSVTANGTGLQTLSIGGFARNIDRIGFAPGTFVDWAALDDITVDAVPEPASVLALALGCLLLKKRK